MSEQPKRYWFEARDIGGGEAVLDKIEHADGGWVSWEDYHALADRESPVPAPDVKQAIYDIMSSSGHLPAGCTDVAVLKERLSQCLSIANKTWLLFHGGESTESPKVLSKDNDELMLSKSTQAAGDETELKARILKALERYDDRFCCDGEEDNGHDPDCLRCELWFCFEALAKRESPTAAPSESELEDILESIRTLVDDDYMKSETDDGEVEYWVNNNSLQHLVDEASKCAKRLTDTARDVSVICVKCREYVGFFRGQPVTKGVGIWLHDLEKENGEKANQLTQTHARIAELEAENAKLKEDLSDTEDMHKLAAEAWAMASIEWSKVVDRISELKATIRDTHKQPIIRIEDTLPATAALAEKAEESENEKSNT